MRATERDASHYRWRPCAFADILNAAMIDIMNRPYLTLCCSVMSRSLHRRRIQLNSRAYAGVLLDLLRQGLACALTLKRRDLCDRIRCCDGLSGDNGLGLGNATRQSWRITLHADQILAASFLRSFLPAGIEPDHHTGQIVGGEPSQSVVDQHFRALLWILHATYEVASFLVGANVPKL